MCSARVVCMWPHYLHFAPVIVLLPRRLSSAGREVSGRERDLKCERHAFRNNFHCTLSWPGECLRTRSKRRRLLCLCVFLEEKVIRPAEWSRGKCYAAWIIAQRRWRFCAECKWKTNQALARCRERCVK